MSIKENIAHINSLKEEAAKRSGRSGDDVLLVAVTKLHDVDEINEAIDCGITDIGENKVQEILDKYDQLPSDIQWHMIGHLQRNKVKYIIDKACMIHSLESLRLAETIQTEAEKHNVIMPVLVEINAAMEESKFGLTLDETPAFIEQVAAFPNIRVSGLMTIAPFVENPEDNRIHFQNLYNLFIDIKGRNIDNVNMCNLSMGMTNDYEVAIEEGATMVRVGTGIFGARDYTQQV